MRLTRVDGCGRPICGEDNGFTFDCFASLSMSPNVEEGEDVKTRRPTAAGAASRRGPDPSLIYAEGRTGLPMADMWLSTVNPHRLTSPSRVYSPDYERPRSQQWP
ncbi:hypothetical protein [Streptomyces sp. KLOTTS4A1]|uniref:hypothetical protein n=1 Tax=Streptomyces sp. KLOTTS4A1 TaxID=3390996 RepID=UPI0039F506B5